METRNLLELFRQISITKVEKGEILLREGDTQKDVYFIKKGLVRSYVTNDKAEEITFQLYPEYHVFGNVHKIFFDEPSHFTHQSLEPTKVYMVEYDSYFSEALKNPNLIDLYRRYLSKRVMQQAFQRVESFVFLSPEERYHKYVREFPNVINRAPDKYIAHVLGSTPVSLSRIRSRIATAKR